VLFKLVCLKLIQRGRLAVADWRLAAQTLIWPNQRHCSVMVRNLSKILDNVFNLAGLTTDLLRQDKCDKPSVIKRLNEEAVKAQFKAIVNLTCLSDITSDCYITILTPERT